MPYATATVLISRFGVAEVARLASGDVEPRPLLDDTEILVKAAADEDLSAYTQEQQDAAAAGLARLQDALARASARIDSSLSARYADAVPLPDADAQANGLPGIAAEIARYLLSDDHSTETVKARHDAAIAWLKEVAAGKALLLGVAQDGSRAGPGMGHVRHGQVTSGFDWEAYPR